jgi:Na+-driven multidrug efflux pump
MTELFWLILCLAGAILTGRLMGEPHQSLARRVVERLFLAAFVTGAILSAIRFSHH